LQFGQTYLQGKAKGFVIAMQLSTKSQNMNGSKKLEWN
jgi:hypothetical protein